MLDQTQLTALLETDSETRWSTILFGLARQHGFDHVLFGVVGSRHARLETAFLLSNYAPRWRMHYESNKLHEVDPTVAHSLVSSVPLIWEPDVFAAPGQREFYEDACGHGIRSGVTLPIHGPNGEFGILSFASDARVDAASERMIVGCMPQLALIRDYAFQSSLRFGGGRHVAEAAPHLTRRELEVLNWVMVGKSSWEISRITSCSEATINFHIANVRQKFNVGTRQQALVKAIAFGLITPEDRRH
jgi:LuxR family quorum-sensing transcriptional regulator LasR